MSRIPKTVAIAWAALALTTSLAACGSTANSSDLALASYKPTSSAGVDTSKWSDYSFTIGDNGGDGSEALAQITGVFAGAPYKVTFARFTYGPPLIQAAASGDIDLGSVGDVPPITGAAQEYGFSVVGVAHYINTTVPDETSSCRRALRYGPSRSSGARRSRSRRAARRTGWPCSRWSTRG